MKYNLTEDQLCDREYMVEFIDNIITKVMESVVRDFRGTTKEELLESHGERAFLDSVNLQFPIINPVSHELDSNMIYMAALKAIKENRDDILTTSINLLEDNDMRDPVTITIDGSEGEFGLVETILKFVWENNLKSG